MKSVLAILMIAAAAGAQSKSGGSGSSISGGSGHSLACGAGYIPVPCVARTDTGLNYDPVTGEPTNGPSTPFTSGPVNTVFIDPWFGERVVRVTNGSTASNHMGDGYQTASAGWARQFNCAGTSLGPTCLTATPMTFAEHLGGGVVVYSFDRPTMTLVRADNASFTGVTIVAGDLPGPWFDAVDPLKLFYTPQNIEDGNTRIASWNWYEFNLASPGSQTSHLLLNMNTGPNGTANDQQTGSGGLISAFNGLLNYVAWPAAIPPAVCDGSACYSGTPQTAISGTTCGSVSGGSAGAACITVSTSGGSLSGKVSFASDYSDAGTPPTEQNISAYGGIGMANWPWTTYNFSGNTGEITAVVAPTQSASPATAANWNVYMASSSLFGSGSSPQTKILLGPRQFQVPIATTSCSGAGGTGGCPTLPYTTLVTAATAAHPTNRSCAPTTAGGSGKCILQQAMQDNSGNYFTFLTGGLQQGQTTLFGVWNTTMGLRYLDTSTGVVTNGGTDANGNACPATTCWPSAGTGQINFHGDPNDLTTSTQVWGGLYAHEDAIDLSGTWIALGNQISPGTNDSFIWWDYTTGDVYMCSQLSTAASCAGHPGYGYNYFVQTGNGQPPIDGNLDERGTILSGAPCAGVGCAFVGTPYIQQISTYSLTGPCPATGPPACAIPSPNFQTNGYDFIGSGRADSHQSLMDEDTNNKMPYALVPYTEVLNYPLSTTASSQSRTSGVDTYTTSGSTAQYFAGDHIQITGLADNSFNIACYVTSTGPVAAGTKTFTCADPGKANGSTAAQTGGGNSYKIDDTPGRSYENEAIMISPAQSSTVAGANYRIAHVHFDLPATGAVTGPNGSVSPDGHYLLFTTTDGSGGIIASSTLGSVSSSGGCGYATSDTGTVNNAVMGASLATYTVTGVNSAGVCPSNGVVTSYSLTGVGTLYTSMNNVQTTATSGSGTGLLLNITINSNQTAGGRSDVGLAEAH